MLSFIVTNQSRICK